MNHSKAQIVATLGPSSSDMKTLRSMVECQLDVVRFNFSWGDLASRLEQIGIIRQLEKEFGREIPIIVDLPGPRVQEEKSHTYDASVTSAITEKDAGFIKFALEQNIRYVAVSFVGNADDIFKCREIIRSLGGSQKIIAKIERAAALEHLDEIIAATDAVMVARGDLGSEVPVEQIPFIQERIIRKSNEAGKPVITATQMLLSMVDRPVPTRAEVTDVANAILLGSDAVMLSEETTIGKYPLETIAMMERIVLEAEKHEGRRHVTNLL